MMTEKGFETEIAMNKTPNFSQPEEKPLKPENLRSKKVDINVLKARAKEIQDKENLKNSIIIIFFLLVLGIAGIYFSI